MFNGFYDDGTLGKNSRLTLRTENFEDEKGNIAFRAVQKIQPCSIRRNGEPYQSQIVIKQKKELVGKTVFVQAIILNESDDVLESFSVIKAFIGEHANEWPQLLEKEQRNIEMAKAIADKVKKKDSQIKS